MLGHQFTPRITTYFDIECDISKLIVYYASASRHGVVVKLNICEIGSRHVDVWKMCFKFYQLNGIFKISEKDKRVSSWFFMQPLINRDHIYNRVICVKLYHLPYVVCCQICQLTVGYNITSVFRKISFES